ncbi:MAG: MarR family winged helix-turn-helix transcriptional regulator [Fidelibacterota bacterium]
MPTDRKSKNVSFLLYILSKFINQIVEQNLIAESSVVSLSRRQFEILKILHISGAFSVSNLARFLMISRPAASKSVHNLVTHGLVERTIPDTDRRMAIVRILPEGERIVERYFQLRRQKENRIFTHFDNKELAELERILHQYITILLHEYRHEVDLICLHCNTSYSEACPLLKEGNKSCYHTLIRSLTETA